MFWILCDPSSGSTELCLTEITRGDSQIFLSCAWSVIVVQICKFIVVPQGKLICLFYMLMCSNGYANIIIEVHYNLC
jgi:hypothetical protein